MPLSKNNPLTDYVVTVFNPTAGSASGSKVYLNVPFKGQVMEVGFMPTTSITSNTTMRVQTSLLLSSTSSVLTEIISSTLGAFNSVMMIEGATASAIPPSPAYVNAGDALQIVTSGGNSSTIGATIYTILRKG